jgi:hypothetical protein
MHRTPYSISLYAQAIEQIVSARLDIDLRAKACWIHSMMTTIKVQDVVVALVARPTGAVVCDYQNPARVSEVCHHTLL